MQLWFSGTTMGSHLFIATLFFASLQNCICDDFKGYSAFANDLSTPLSNATSSENWARNIFARQDGWTCTAGSPFVICPTPQKCCSASDNCQPTQCCPKTAETCGGKICAEAGTVCCGDTGCKAGAACRRSSGGRDVCCTAADDVACDDGYCCKAGATCIAGALCQRNRPSTSRLVSSSQSPSSSTVRVTPTPSVSLSRSPSAAQPSAKKPKTTSSCTSTPASAPTGAGAWEWIKVEGEKDCVPVLDFICVDDLFDQMCTSMCQGIRDQEQRNPERVISDRAILLHRRNGRSAASGCRSMGCAQRVTYSSLYQRYFTMQCDEFPPASTMEGGGPTLVCISWYQNILGGSYLRYFYNDLSLAQDAPFVIRMDTCDFPSAPLSYPQGQEPSLPPSKRQIVNELTMYGNASPLWVRDPRTESEGYVFMPLNGSGPGTYGGTLSFSDTGGLSDISIIDGGGGLIWNNSGTWIGGERKMQYQIEDDTQDLCVAAKASRSVSISASFTATGSSTIASSSRPASRAILGPKSHLPSVLIGTFVGIVWV